MPSKRVLLREARVLSRSLIPTSPVEEAEETGEVDDEVAKRRRVSDELGRLEDLLGRVDSELSEEDKIVVERARRIERFFSQPFAVATAFTGLEGKYVTIEDTVRSFKELIEGKWDHLPLGAFMYVGSIEEAVEKAEKLKSES